MSGDCCAPQHLVIVGGGSAAFAAARRARDLGARATIVNAGLPIGGTCVNVGCVPSKALLRAAGALHHAGHLPFAGLESTARVADFRALVAEKRALVETLRQTKYVDVATAAGGIDLVEGRARLVAPDAVEVDGRRLAGDAIVLATGAAPWLPPVPGLAEAAPLTNETIYELDAVPESLLVLGGRYVALETGQTFARFGSRVTILERSAHVLPTEAPALTDALAAYLRAEGIRIETNVRLRHVRRTPAGVTVEAAVDGAPRTFQATHLLAATGRRPNTRGLGLEAAGVACDERGFVRVDATLRTTAPGVYAAGDVAGDPMYVYTAAYEGGLAAENALTGAARPRDYTALPWVVFTDPQVAGVGLDERAARAAGYDAEATTLALAHVPRALVGRDTRGFVTLVRDRETDRLLGARVLAPEGAELLMELALAIAHDIPVRALAARPHPYLTLGEAVRLAALSFDTDPARLSCCAS